MVKLSINKPITICIFLLLSMSILIIYSSSMQLAIQQIFFALAGLLIYFTISRIGYISFANFVRLAYITILFLLILVFILGVETRGVIRWIPLGFINIQPSEFAKPVIILFLAHFWSTNIRSWANILKSILWVSPVGFLVFKQPDLGTTITIFAIWLGMLFACGLELKKIIILSLLIFMMMPLTWFVIADYQKQRITSFLWPNQDPLGVGYNIIQSTIAVGSGQLLGRGLGQGTQSRLQFLPEYRTDFIFAAISEELGLLGALMILCIFFFLIVYGLRAAQMAADYPGYMIAIGVSIMILFQTLINVGMNIGILPITGVTLPLISYGGSSLIATLICLGLLASVANMRKRVDILTVGM